MKTNFFIIFIVGIVLVIGGLGFYLNKDSSAFGKFDEFAKALKEKGVIFYGTFWCPHCQAQKAEFGSSKKYLPYVECSNLDQTQTQVCIDNKIEGYPDWKFKDGVKITSASEPVVCSIFKEGIVLEKICEQKSSLFNKVWLFEEYNFSVKSPSDPVKINNVWQFPSNVELVGEVPLSFLAEQIQFNLPK